MISAKASVSRQDIMVSVAGRNRVSRVRCMTTPRPKNTGTVSASENNGSSPVVVVKNQAM